MHEVTEAYEGAKISMKSGVSSPVAGIAGSVYEKAHNRATKQSAITERMYGIGGKEVFDTKLAVRREYSVSRRGRSYVFYSNTYRVR